MVKPNGDKGKRFNIKKVDFNTTKKSINIYYPQYCYSFKFMLNLNINQVKTIYKIAQQTNNRLTLFHRLSFIFY